MIILPIATENIHLIPDTTNLDIIGNVEISYLDSTFRYAVNYFTNAQVSSFPTSKPKSIFELNENRFGYVYLDDRNYVGHSIVENRFNNTLYIEDFAIHSDYRGKGYAHKLMDFIISNSKYNGISLEVQNTNVVAFLFYMKYGFCIGGFDTLFYENTVQKGDVAIYLYYSI